MSATTNANGTALLMVDIQNDFCPLGALAVADGAAIVPIVNRLQGKFQICILAQDWHPADHGSFASSHQGAEPFSVTQMPYGDQVLWPDHCVQGTRGAEFHPDLITDGADLVLRKGFRREIDSYSAFYENDHTTRTGLEGYLRERDVTHLVITGLATDFCVYYSAMDATKLGFQVTLVPDACGAIDLDGSLAAANEAMAGAGVAFVMSDKF